MTEETRAATGDPRPSALDTAPEPGMTFKEALSAGGRATLGVLLGLQLLDSVDNAVFAIFTPEIRESLGVSSSAVSNVGSLTGVMVALAALPLGVLGDRRRRTTIAGVCTLAWALAAALLGMVQNLWQAAAVRILAGIGKANEGPIQISILTDAYPPAGRGRVLGVHRGAQPLGVVAGPAFAALVAAVVPEEHEPPRSPWSASCWRWPPCDCANPSAAASSGRPRSTADHRPRTPRPCRCASRSHGCGRSAPSTTPCSRSARSACA